MEGLATGVPVCRSPWPHECPLGLQLCHWGCGAHFFRTKTATKVTKAVRLSPRLANSFVSGSAAPSPRAPCRRLMQSTTPVGLTHHPWIRGHEDLPARDRRGLRCVVRHGQPGIHERKRDPAWRHAATARRAGRVQAEEQCRSQMAGTRVTPSLSRIPREASFVFRRLAGIRVCSAVRVRPSHEKSGPRWANPGLTPPPTPKGPQLAPSDPAYFLRWSLLQSSPQKRPEWTRPALPRRPKAFPGGFLRAQPVMNVSGRAPSPANHLSPSPSCNLAPWPRNPASGPGPLCDAGDPPHGPKGGPTTLRPAY